MRSRFLSVVIFLTAILQVTSQVTVAQISLQTHNAIRARYDAADFTGTESLLREVLSKQPELFARNNYDYLLARVYESQGKLTEAREVYRQVISRKSVLSAYATWHLAELARSQGNSGEEQEYLKQLLGQSGDFLNIDSARTRLGTSLYRSRKYSEAIDILRPQAGLSGARSRESLARIGEAQLALGQDSAARGTMESLVGGSRDDAALRGIAALDRMDFQARAKLTEAEHLRRARIYQFNRAFAEARNHWLEIIKQFPVSSNRAEAAWETGRGFQWEDKFREAIPYFQMAYDANPKSDEGEQGFYYVGHCYQYLNEDRPAIARYTDFIRIYPQSKFLGYAYLNAIDTLRAVGKDAEALSWAQRAQTEVKDPFIQVTGLFQQARIHLSMGDFAAALNDFNSLKGRNLSVRGLVAGPNQAEASFMVAYCLEQLGRTTEAISAYLGFVESRSGASGYYGMRATMRLRALQANSKTSAVVKAKAEDFARQAREAGKAGDPSTARLAASQALRLASTDSVRNEMRSIIRTSYGKIPAYSRPPAYPLTVSGRTSPLTQSDSAVSTRDHKTLASELMFLGVMDEGAPELIASGQIGDTFSQVVYAKRGNSASRGLTFAEQATGSLPDDYRPELMTREIAELLYPWIYSNALRKFTIPRKVDPRFLLSIARQESRYDSKVKSQAAARGLLQFISSTSTELAGQLGLKDFEQDDLYNPDIAIEIGSQYMKNLYQEFGNWQAVAAAYNGSEQSVRRWIKRAKSPDVDRFVIEIGKRETKDYVYKVLTNFWAYQELYPE